MICEKCGVTNNPEAKFCIGCGKPLNTQNPSEISMYNLGSMPNSIKQNSEMQVSPNMQTMQEQTTTISHADFHFIKTLYSFKRRK